MALQIELQRLRSIGSRGLPAVVVLDVGGLLRHVFNVGARVSELWQALKLAVVPPRQFIWVVGELTLPSPGVTAKELAQALKTIQAGFPRACVIASDEPLPSLLDAVLPKSSVPLGVVTANIEDYPFESFPLASGLRAILDVATGKLWTPDSLIRGIPPAWEPRLCAIAGAEPGDQPLGSKAAPRYLDKVLSHIAMGDAPGPHPAVRDALTRNALAIDDRERQLLAIGREDHSARQQLAGELRRIATAPQGRSDTGYVVADIRRTQSRLVFHGGWVRLRGGWQQVDETAAHETLRQLRGDYPDRWFGPHILDVLGWAHENAIALPASAFDPALCSFVLDPDVPLDLRHVTYATWRLESAERLWLSDYRREQAAPTSLVGIRDSICEIDVDLGYELRKLNLEPLVQQDIAPTLPVMAKIERTGALVSTPRLLGSWSAFESAVRARLRKLESVCHPVLGGLDPYQADALLLVLEIKRRVQLPPSEVDGISPSQELKKLMHVGPSELKALQQLRSLGATSGLLWWAKELGYRPKATSVSIPLVTGRWGMRDLALQMLPRRGRGAGVVASSLVAPPGYRLIAADYNAFEVRILAAICSDPLLLHAVQQPDAHAQLASMIFGSPSKRAWAKLGVYAIIYGAGRDGFWKSHPELPRATAEMIFDTITGKLATAVAYRDSYLTRYRKQRAPYVQTPGGWQRTPRDRFDVTRTKTRAALREAFNTLIQGQAADIFRWTLRQLDSQLASVGATIAHQAHDEVYVLAPDAQVAAATSLVVGVMQSAAQASPELARAGVPLFVKPPRSGKTWAAIR